MRSPVTVEERVAVTVWKLATNIEYRTLASLFGLGRSTVGKIVLETCTILSTKLLSRYVHFPEGTRLHEVVDGFEVCWGFPQVAGAIDGTHIPIIRPQDNPSDYYNRKGFYSVVMQAVVDSVGCSWTHILDGLVKYMMRESFRTHLYTVREEKIPYYLVGKGKSME